MFLAESVTTTRNDVPIPVCTKNRDEDFFGDSAQTIRRKSFCLSKNRAGQCFSAHPLHSLAPNALVLPLPVRVFVKHCQSEAFYFIISNDWVFNLLRSVPFCLRVRVEGVCARVCDHDHAGERQM